MEVMYKVKATSEGGRDGKVKTEDGHVELKLATPKEMGGQGGGANPEGLFAAGYAACFSSAIAMAARRHKAEIGDVEVTSTVGVGPNGKGGFKFSVKLEANIPGVDSETARKLAEEAETICPFANATRGNIDVELVVTNK